MITNARTKIENAPSKRNAVMRPHAERGNALKIIPAESLQTTAGIHRLACLLTTQKTATYNPQLAARKSPHASHNLLRIPIQEQGTG